MQFNLIVAMCRNNGIGYKGQMPWRISQDLEYFSKITKGNGNNVVIMGNKTWESLPIKKNNERGLNGRDNFILSSKNNFEILINDNHLVKTFISLDEMEIYLNKNNIYEEIWIIGGASIYKQILETKKIKYCYITIIDMDFECDTFFPVLNNSEWKEIKCQKTYDLKYDCNVSYVVYENIPLQ
jgi:dihydrofolate reductase